MNVKLKALGLAVMAALAVSAVTVMPAPATTGGHFISGDAHTTLSGIDDATNPPKFHAFGNTVTCKHATYSATSDAVTETEITTTAVYGECEVSGVGPATVNMNNCDYVFTINTNPSGSDNTTHLECTGATGPKITVNSPLSSHDCIIEVTPDQTPTGGVVYKAGSSGGKADITVEATASNIHAVITTAAGNFFACGTTSSTTSTAQLTGNATVTGKNTAGNAVDISAT